jgi:hypothetical protein
MSLLSSEKVIAEALIKDLKTNTRGGNSPTPGVDDILAEAFGKKPPAPKPNKPKRTYVPGVTAKISFKPTVSKVGGREIGVVQMTVNGKTARIVEIAASLPGYPVSKRATLVAERLDEMNKKDKMWWSTLSVGSINQEVVVKAPKSRSGTVVTADPEWAKEWGVGRTQLATMVIRNIRTSMDSLAHKARGESPADRRLGAAQLRMEGDSLFDGSAAAAEAKYLEAIQKDSTYGVPYNRLADLYMSQGRREDARAVLQRALGVEGLSAEDRTQISLRLAEIG